MVNIGEENGGVLEVVCRGACVMSLWLFAS